MSADPVISLVIGVPFIGFLIYAALSYAYAAGKKGEAGMDIPGAIISIAMAGAFIFFLGQQFPHIPILESWFFMSADPRY